MIKRLLDDDEQDNYLIIEGETGSGKTNASVGIAHIVAQATNREFDVNNVFFDTEKAINYAKSTSHKIIIFDEPVFHALKVQWRNKTQINLIKLIFTSRKKRHFVIFNLVKFSKFSDDIIEKAIALIRVYKKSETKKERRFLYIPHKNLPLLLNTYRKRHKRSYFKYAIIGGTLFRYVLPEIIDKEKYEAMKDEAIMSIGDEDGRENNSKKLMKMQFGIHKFIKEKGIKREEIARYLGCTPNTLSHWAKIQEKHGIFIINEMDSAENEALIINNGEN
jgi:DNA-binding transcriptional regulator YiaG